MKPVKKKHRQENSACEPSHFSPFSDMERSKLSREKENVRSIDRFSALTDAILCHILSFLPTKLSVATSILAKRLRFLWALVPNLHFESECLDRELSNLDIINRVMSLYKVQSMNTFRLSFMMGGGDDKRTKFQLGTCIAAAVARNVKELDLCYLRVLSPCIFTCKTLVELRLYCCVEIPAKGRVCLPALKCLCLNYVVGESNESLQNLLSGCPVLEGLGICMSQTNEYMDCCHICSSTLKILILKSNSLGFAKKAYGLKLHTPALASLCIEGFKFKDISAGVLTRLIKADIDFNDDAHVLCSRSTLEFIGSLRKVKSLKLSTGLLKALNSISSALTLKFHRLTRLELVGDWHFLPSFLGNADNLEILILDKVNTDLQYWIEPHSVPRCLSSHLRIVRIFGRSGFTEVELELINYILRNAKVLERMEVYPKHNGTEFKA